MHGIEIPQDPRHLGVPSGASKMISEPMVRSAQTVHLSCVKVSTISKQTENELPLEPCHLGVPSGGSKIISEHMVRSAQTVHLSCVKIRTISNHTETSFRYLGVTFGCAQSDFHARATFGAKPFTYLAPRLTLSPNGSKLASC